MVEKEGRNMGDGADRVYKGFYDDDDDVPCCRNCNQWSGVECPAVKNL